jgi:TorA maturation chaperone TorD
MLNCKPCHLLLTIPSEGNAEKAEELASKIFKRVLATWAQDLLIQLRQSKEHQFTGGPTLLVIGR